MEGDLRGSLAFCCAMTVFACGGDKGTPGPAGATADAASEGSSSSGADSSSGATDSICKDGCVATLAAGCSNGPSSQTQCEQDCQMLVAGSCSASYQALQACAAGKAITCNGAGMPTIEACSNEQGAFVACATSR